MAVPIDHCGRSPRGGPARARAADDPGEHHLGPAKVTGRRAWAPPRPSPGQRDAPERRRQVNGLTYGALTYLPARDRLDWLDRSTGYSPQPFEQLAGYYRRLGHDEQARRVLFAKERQRRRERAWWLRWWGWLQDALAGYGYAPGRALLLLLARSWPGGWSSPPASRSRWARARTRPSTPPYTPSTC